MLPVVPNKRQLPKQDKWPFLSLDVDGYDLPADWYVACRMIAVSS